MKSVIIVAWLLASITISVQAKLIDISDCQWAISCQITTTPPSIVAADPNDGMLLAWDEMQSLMLTKNVRVDQVFDHTASYVGHSSNGRLLINKGTRVSSHYFQWDPGNDSGHKVKASISFDAPIIALITADKKLFNTDSVFGLANVTFDNFTLRGLEKKDQTTINANQMNILWQAGSPGDWARVFTLAPATSLFASKSVAQVSEPPMLMIFSLLLLIIQPSIKRKSFLKYIFSKVSPYFI